MKIIYLFLLATVAVMGQAKSEGLEDIQYKVHNLIEEHIACYTYYKITEENLRRPENSTPRDIQLADNYEIGADGFLERAYLLANILNMKEETILAKVEMHVKDQMNEIDNDYINFSILLNKYAEDCQYLYDNLEDVIKNLEIQ